MSLRRRSGSVWHCVRPLHWILSSGRLRIFECAWKRRIGFSARSSTRATSFMKKATGKWVQNAEADLLAAKQLASAAHSFHDHICNNCQQSAEKYFKAFLHEMGVAFRRTHDLEELLDLALPHDKTLARLRRGL